MSHSRPVPELVLEKVSVRAPESSVEPLALDLAAVVEWLAPGVLVLALQSRCTQGFLLPSERQDCLLVPQTKLVKAFARRLRVMDSLYHEEAFRLKSLQP